MNIIEIPSPNFSAGRKGYYTLGIGHEGYKDSEWTDAMYDSCAELAAITNLIPVS